MNVRKDERNRKPDHAEHVELSEEEWREVEPLLLASDSRNGRGRPSRDHRTLLEGVLWVLRTGAAWRDLPARYGPWQTAYTRFRRWRREGQLKAIVERLELAFADRRQWDGRLGSRRPAREGNADDEATKT